MYKLLVSALALVALAGSAVAEKHTVKFTNR